MLVGYICFISREIVFMLLNLEQFTLISFGQSKQHTTFKVIGKVKVCVDPTGPSGRRLSRVYAGKTKRIRVFLSPSPIDGILVNRRITPSINILRYPSDQQLKEFGCIGHGW